MLDHTLSAEQRAELRAAHRCTRNQHEADQIKAVVSLARGWPAEQVAEVLLLDPNTVRNHFRRYQQGGLPGLLEMAYQGSDCALTDTDLVALDIAGWVAEEFGVTYTSSGMTELLHRLGFVYNEPKLVPGKADPKAQEAFLAAY